jgi:hypothetical protein
MRTIGTWGIGTLAIVLAVGFVFGCQRSDSALHLQQDDALLRPLSADEALSDLSELSGYLTNLYAPYQYKEKRFGYKISDLVSQAESDVKAAKTDDEVFGAYAKLLAKLHDGHVSIRFPLSSTGISKYNIPLFIYPVENTVLVGSVGDGIKDTKIKIGDEVLSVDGQAPMDYLPLITKYASFATEESQRHLITRLFDRPAYATELTPVRSRSTVVLKRPDGQIYQEELLWESVKSNPAAAKLFFPPNGPALNFPGEDDYNRVASGTLLQLGSVTPFFMTSQAQGKYGFREVFTDAEHRSKHGLKDNDKPNIYAALYRYKGKTVLLVRSYTYHHEDFSNEIYMRGYAAILDQWEDLADVLVLDQTHNGGGSYCEDFFRLFTKTNADSSAERFHADRTWLVNLATWADQTDKAQQPAAAQHLRWMASVISTAYDAGLWLTAPIAWLSGANSILTPADYHWKKPMIVLTDELSASCADIFPALIKHNKTAMIFGERTMGAGGNVETFGTLTHSRTTVTGTRGLFVISNPNGVYTESDYIENNGVMPDLLYDHTVTDTRAGYVKYIESFSNYALAQIP